MISKLLLTAALSGVGGCSTLGELVSVYFAPGDRDLMLDIAACESSADPDDVFSTATNPKTGAAGWFQHMPHLFPSRAASAGFEDANPYNPTQNVAVAAHIYYTLNSNERWGGASHWYPSNLNGCWELP